MSVTVIEYAGISYGTGGRQFATPSISAGMTVTVLSSGALSTMFLQPNTQMVELIATANAWFQGSASTLSSTAPNTQTSTNSAPIPALNTSVIRGAKGGTRLIVLST